jgi:heterodisulfide reductase subunit D
VANTEGIADYYRAITMLEKVLLDGQERRWLLKMPDDPPQTENLIYLGCNILKTLHLVQTLMLLLDSLGVDYLAVGGPAFCCGIVHRRAQNIAAGERLFDRSQREFDAFAPKTLVQWCPSCEERLDELVSDQNALPYDVVHFTEFLMGLLAKVEWRRPVPLRVALHAHAANHSERETAFVSAILSRVPGIEVVELLTSPELGSHCSAARVDILGRPSFRGLLQAEVARSRDLGVDALVSVYHSCHREVARYAEGQPEVLNYTTIVARALGLPEPEDVYQRLLSEDFDALAARLLPVAQAEGIRADIAERVLRTEFSTR